MSSRVNIRFCSRLDKFSRRVCVPLEIGLGLNLQSVQDSFLSVCFTAWIFVPSQLSNRAEHAARSISRKVGGLPGMVYVLFGIRL